MMSLSSTVQNNICIKYKEVDNCLRSVGMVGGQKKTGTKMTTIQIEIWQICTV
jgi:hypothetical protein